MFRYVGAQMTISCYDFRSPNIQFHYVHIKKKLKIKLSVESNHKIIFLIKNTILNNHMSSNFLYFIDSLDNTSNILADKNEPCNEPCNEHSFAELPTFSPENSTNAKLPPIFYPDNHTNVKLSPISVQLSQFFTRQPQFFVKKSQNSVQMSNRDTPQIFVLLHKTPEKEKEKKKKKKRKEKIYLLTRLLRKFVCTTIIHIIYLYLSSIINVMLASETSIII